MTETLAIVLASNLFMLSGVYWILKYRPSLLAKVAPEPVMVSLNGTDPMPEVAVTQRLMKVCMFCDEPISKMARRCPHCTSNLPAHGG